MMHSECICTRVSASLQYMYKKQQACMLNILIKQTSCIDVSNIRVPKLSFYVGASYGAGNYGMAGYGFDPDFLFTWPGAMTGVMSGESAAGTMETVALNAAKRRGVEPAMEALAKQRAAIEAVFAAQEDAFFTSGRLLASSLFSFAFILVLHSSKKEDCRGKLFCFLFVLPMVLPRDRFFPLCSYFLQFS